MCVFQPLHALISVYRGFWELRSEASWLGYYLSGHCGLSKLKQVMELDHEVFLLFTFVGFQIT